MSLHVYSAKFLLRILTIARLTNKSPTFSWRHNCFVIKCLDISYKNVEKT